MELADASRPAATAGAATLSSSLTTTLRDAILRGELAPGARLRLEALKERYDVSFSPLREALTRLSAEGLVQTTAQRGYRVAPVSLANLEEVTTLRVTLECMALGESIAHGDDAWEDALVAAYHRLARLEAGDRSGANLPAWEQAHRQFHVTLFSAANMPLLIQICHTLHDLSDRYRRLYLSSRAPDRDVPSEHKAIFDAAMARDATKAVAVLRQHLERTGQNLQRVLPQETVAG